jgi:hypothetical protein
MSAAVWAVGLGVAVCRVEAAAGVHALMRPYLDGLPARAAPGAPRVRLVVRVDADTVGAAWRRAAGEPTRARRLSHPSQEYRAVAHGSGELLTSAQADDHAVVTSPGTVTVLACDEAAGARVAVRVVRQVLMRAGERAGGRSVHAAVAVVDGRGVLLTGSPGAGKTSVLHALMAGRGACPVANDRAVIVPRGRGRWTAIGVPLAWRFTPQAVAASPLLAEGISPSRRRRGQRLVDGKQEFAPQEVARLLGVRPAHSAPVDEVVVLGRDRVEATALSLREGLDFGPDDPFACDWLDLVAVAGLAPAKGVQGASWWAGALADLTPRARFEVWADPSQFAAIAERLGRPGRAVS